MGRRAFGFAGLLVFLGLLLGCSGTFTRDTVLEGTVTDVCGGGPVGGATVALDGKIIVTGQDGAFFFEALIPGEYPYEVSAAEYAGQSGSTAIRSGTNRMDFALARLEHAEIFGRVNDQTIGEPVQGVTVTLGERQASTDTDGSFAFGGLEPGPYLLKASAAGFQPWSMPLDVPLARIQVAVKLARSGLGGSLVFGGLVSGKRDIYLMDAAGGAKTALTSTGVGNYRPSLSPDGTRVLFAREMNGVRTIWAMNRDGSGAHSVTAGPTDDYPSWSPDGGRIAFQSVRDGGNRIVVADPDGSRQADLGPGRFPTWSSDGLQVAFVTSGQIHIIPSDGGTPRPIGPDSGAYYPAWSPDGLHLALSLKEGVEMYGLYILTIATGELRRLAGGGIHLRSSFSPDGTMVAFHTIGADSPTTQIYVIPFSGGVPALWVSRSGGESQDPSWR